MKKRRRENIPWEDRHTQGEHPVTMESETEALQLQGKECLRLLEEKARKYPPLEDGSTNTLISSFWPPVLWENKFLHSWFFFNQSNKIYI